ncbi:MAG: glycosyltransferase family 39 protein [Chloroflexota bacterium]|nr:glycosyltransferase family 39 protein [Chloroflexota bacterium]
MKHIKFSPHACAAALLCLFAFAMSAILSRTVFERLPHLEDEVAYLFQARTYAGGHLVIDTPEPEDAYWQPFVVDYNGRRFGKYTPGFPALLALGVLVGQTWIVNALFGAAGVALVYRLGRDAFDADTGLIAAALVAFSPMALLLNATLMGHTAALCCTVLFMWCMLKIERASARHRYATAWAVAAGIALGILLATRALTAIAVALPFAVWSARRLVSHRTPQRSGRAVRVSPLRPLIILALIAIVFGLSIPIYSAAATGDPFKNLYTLVWSYDRVGFGAGAGRNIHTLEKGIRHARFDLSLTAADLFGWQIGTIDDDARDHLDTEADFYPYVGVSWILLPFALVIMYRWRALLVALWLAALAAWIVVPHLIDGGRLTRDPAFAYAWVATALAWVVLPLLFWRPTLKREPHPESQANDPSSVSGQGFRAAVAVRRRWTWLLLSVALCLIGVQVAYWIGSQRYSTRYFYEALPSLALISALPLAGLARRGLRLGVYALVTLVLAYSLFAYSLPRIGVLYRYNQISPALVEGIAARRDGDRPVLALVTGSPVRWRAFGALMVQTSPYLNSDIVAAWDYRAGAADDVRAAILARFPDRQVIELDALENQAWFADEQPPQAN